MRLSLPCWSVHDRYRFRPFGLVPLDTIWPTLQRKSLGNCQEDPLACQQDPPLLSTVKLIIMCVRKHVLNGTCTFLVTNCPSFDRHFWTEFDILPQVFKRRLWKGQGECPAMTSHNAYAPKSRRLVGLPTSTVLLMQSKWKPCKEGT